jgi:signal transduction histidine kinase
VIVGHAEYWPKSQCARHSCNRSMDSMTLEVSSSARTNNASHDAAPTLSTERERALQLTVAGGLVAAVTHDLRQPLTALEMNICAALQFLKAPTLQLDGALDSLRDALVQQSRMRESLQVLDDLAVRREPLCEAIDAVPIARAVVALVGSDVMARHASLDLVVTPPVGKVFADATLMRQALLNMVLDALEATSLSPRQEKPVQITVRQVDDIVEVAVTHFGLRDETAGVDGWGLALARSVVVAHGGTIELEGDADVGVRLVTRWPTTSSGVPQGAFDA